LGRTAQGLQGLPLGRKLSQFFGRPEKINTLFKYIFPCQRAKEKLPHSVPKGKGKITALCAKGQRKNILSFQFMQVSVLDQVMELTTLTL
jgi:hypothetical protein